jgi:hypothetical protein
LVKSSHPYYRLRSFPGDSEFQQNEATRGCDGPEHQGLPSLPVRYSAESDALRALHRGVEIVIGMTDPLAQGVIKRRSNGPDDRSD